MSIGVILPESGVMGGYGQFVRKGVDLALDELKPKTGGRIEVHYVAESSDPAKDAQGLIDNFGVSAIIGSVFSSSSIPIAEVAQANKVVMISPTATAAELTQPRDYVFRAAVIDADEATSMAQYATGTLRARTAAVLYDGGPFAGPVGRMQAEAFRDEFVRNGGTVTVFAPLALTPSGPDAGPLIQSVVSARPDVVYLPGDYHDANAVIPQLHNAALNVPVLGTSAWGSSTETPNLAIRDTYGSYYTDHFSTLDPHYQARRFTSDYRATYGEYPNALAALGYDATRLLVEAIVKAKFGDSADIRRELADTVNYQGPTGKIRRFVGGNPEKSIVLMDVDVSGVSYQDTLRP